MKIDINDLPDPIKKRVQKTLAEVDDISDEAYAAQKTQLKGGIAFTYKHGAPTDILSPFERAQSICFITRYEHLPTLKIIDILKHKDKFYLENIYYLRHILNEYRSIVANQKDSIYFSKIHKFCHKKLKNRDHRTGLSITVENEKDGDITETFTKILGERNKSIKIILRRCEFDYIYNGIFIRSDHWNNRETIAHELVHVSQYERFGNIQEFLSRYIPECINPGYPNGPLEQEARNKAKLITT